MRFRSCRSAWIPTLLLAAFGFAPTLPAGAATTDESPAPAASSGEAGTDAVANSVVKVFSTVRYPDPYRPWTRQAPVEFSGSGVVLEGRRILTCAHVVLYASQVQVQANQAGDKVSATVEAVAPGIDLAVLKLDDETFFDSHAPLPREKALPEIREAVMAYGYPRGGTSLSITKGIVSRVEFVPYNYLTTGLRIQIDAAINPGNSGGPAVVGNKMVGLAFGLLNNSQNIGYIIPCEEIDLFLNDIKSGHYHGKPSMFDDCQAIENGALRPFLKLPKPVAGVVVHKPDSTDPAYPLKEWDVITRIGDMPIDDQGMIKVNDNLRVSFKYQVQKIARNGTVGLTVVRAGKELKVDVPVSSHRSLVISDLQGSYPSYFVFGPLVFSSATIQFLGGYTRGSNGGGMMAVLSAVGSPLVKRVGDKPAFEGEQLCVVSSPFFPHRLSKGYQNPAGQVVKTINGIEIKNLNHLVEVLRDAKDEFVVIEFDNRGGETLVFPRAEMVAATDEILTDNDLRSQGSPDTLAIWNAKPSR